MNERTFRRSNQPRGVAYSLGEFARKYDLDDERAADPFYRFGPSSVELDLLMAAKQARRQELPFVGE